MSQEHLQISIDWNSPNVQYQEGQEKRVCKVSLRSGDYAYKEYLQENSVTDEPIDGPASTITEFQLYRAAAQHPDLRIFVPKPHQIVFANNKPVGFLVEWREGHILADTPRIAVPKLLLEQLKRVLLNLPSDLWLSDDCFTDNNLGWDGKRLWLAELALGDYDSEALWQRVVHRVIERSLKEYGT